MPTPFDEHRDSHLIDLMLSALTPLLSTLLSISLHSSLHSTPQNSTETTKLHSPASLDVFIYMPSGYYGQNNEHEWHLFMAVHALLTFSSNIANIRIPFVRSLQLIPTYMLSESYLSYLPTYISTYMHIYLHTYLHAYLYRHSPIFAK